MGVRSDDSCPTVTPGPPTTSRLTVVWTESTAHAAVHERAGGRCESCGSSDVSDWAHRIPEGQGGPKIPENGVHQCRPCHQMCEGFHRYAREGGWRLLNTEDPTVVPVYLVTHEGAAWWLLGYDEFGHVLTWVDPEEYGLPVVPTLPREFPARARREREALRAEERAAREAYQDRQAAEAAAAAMVGAS